MASYLAAGGEPCAGLVLYAYPLHPVRQAGPPPGRSPSRSAGTHALLHREPGFDGPADLVDRWIVPLEGATIEIIPEADHGFRVPKRSGRTHEQVIDRAVARTSEWIAALE